MPYELQAAEPIEAALHRIAGEQLDRALAELDDPDLDRHTAVHQVRKRCKKIRGLLRLVRPALGGTYRFENAWYRDAARDLGWIRDAQSSLESLHTLLDDGDRRSGALPVEPVEAWLLRRRDQVAAQQGRAREALDQFRERLRQGRARVDSWSLSRDGFDALRGVTDTYRRGRRAMAATGKDSATECFHEWRKRAKYHWYQLRLLHHLHPAMIKAQRRQAGRLGALLGDEHDLAVLRELLLASDDHGLDEATLQPLLVRLEQRRSRVRRKARALGALLYCEKPGQLERRLRCYWRRFSKC